MAQSTTKRDLLKSEDDIELWRITHHDDPSLEVFLVKDPRRTPEDWTFRLRPEAEAKFSERVKNAQTEPPILPR